MKNMPLFVIVSLLVTTVFVAATGEAALNDLIRQNVRDADQTYSQTISPLAQKSALPRLWIHVRTEQQKRVGEELYQALAGSGFDRERIERKPVQLVDSGPAESELRYFKKEDAPEVGKLFDVLQRFIPGLTLKDFSKEYARVRWIKRGHFELWLAPDVVRLRESY